jgi:outer membrane protein assembly factor BamB
MSRTNIRGLAWCAAITCCSALCAEDWPHWRGPSRNDRTTEVSGWDGAAWNLKEAWTANSGEGSSSPIIEGDRCYLFGWRDEKEIVSCLDVATGKSQWSVDYPAPRYGRLALGDQGIYSGPCSTPEFDADTALLYTLGTDGDLNCWDTRQQGKNVWRLNLYETFHVPVRPQVGRSGHRDYGYTSSPLVHGDWLIIEVGAPTGTLVAFDKLTGKQVWASKATSPAGHNGGPVPMIVEGVPCVAVHCFDGLLVVRLDAGHEGETVATVPWVTDFANNVATAAVHENNVVITSSYNHHKAARFRITLAGGAEKVWELEEASKVCSPLIVDGRVYWAWHEMVCIDFETGRLLWRGGQLGDPGSLVATADDKFILWANRGDLTLIEGARRSPDGFKEIASQRGVGRDDAWPHVVLANERLYCKDRSGHLVCFKVNNAASPR